MSDGDGEIVLERGIDSLRAHSRAVQTEVVHNYKVVSASSDSAEVTDQYVDKSVFIDAQSHEIARSDTSAGTNAEDPIMKETYYLHKFDSTWKVVNGTVPQ